GVSAGDVNQQMPAMSSGVTARRDEPPPSAREKDTDAATRMRQFHRNSADMSAPLRWRQRIQGCRLLAKLIPIQNHAIARRALPKQGEILRTENTAGTDSSLLGACAGRGVLLVPGAASPYTGQGARPLRNHPFLSTQRRTLR